MRAAVPFRGMRPSFFLLALLLCAGLMAPAAFASGEDVARDCAEDGQLSKRYSSSELRKGYNLIPTDVDEYSDCRDVIRRAQLDGGSRRDAAGSPGAGAGGGGASGGGVDPPGGSGAGTPPPPRRPGGDQLAGATPEERRRVDALRADSDRSGKVGGAVVRAAGGAKGADIPLPLLVMLILGALAAAGAGGYAIRSRGLTRGAV